MSQITYTLDLDFLDDVGAGFVATKSVEALGSKPKVVLPKSHWVDAGRPTKVTVVMGEPENEVKEDPEIKNDPSEWLPGQPMRKPDRP